MIGRPERIVLARDPDYDPADAAMQFRLTYEGELLGASRSNTRAGHKHAIRRAFHRQLRRLWQVHPAFEGSRPDPDYKGSVDEWFKHSQAAVIENYERAGFRFYPLATRQLSLLCGIDILFLRPDTPGSVIASGDIDNRLKTIFDALRMPRDRAEAGGCSPSGDEDPFFCLLEDDSLISSASVETDTLLQPTGSEWDRNDARLVITARLTPYLAPLLRR